MKRNQRAELGVALVGYGYWGPNLARNFSRQPGCRLLAICELQDGRRRLAAREYPATRVTANFSDLLTDTEIDALLIATSVSSHFELCKQALEYGKDVLVTKPLVQTFVQAEELVYLAGRYERILAVDHTFLYTGAVLKIKELIEDGELGDVIYLDSVRINLGMFQQDVNVVFDLASHDLSIATYLIAGEPSTVQAIGSCYASDHLESIAYIHLTYDNGSTAHFHVSWVSPVKIRRTLIAGSNKMIVYDDLEPSEKVKVYDKGLVLNPDDRIDLKKARIDYRIGDMLAPKLLHREALDVEAEHFLDCVRSRRQPRSGAELGMKVVRMLEACQQSMRRDGVKIHLREGACATR